MFVLDTNTLIYFFKGMGAVSSKLLNTPPQEIGIPTVVLYELEVGIAKSSWPHKRMQQLEALAETAAIMTFGWKEAKAAAQIRVTLEKSGISIGPYDILIAATALANRATLVTHNSNEFSRIENLAWVDWY